MSATDDFKDSPPPSRSSGRGVLAIPSITKFKRSKNPRWEILYKFEEFLREVLSASEALVHSPLVPRAIATWFRVAANTGTEDLFFLYDCKDRAIINQQLAIAAADNFITAKFGFSQLAGRIIQYRTILETHIKFIAADIHKLTATDGEKRQLCLDTIHFMEVKNDSLERILSRNAVPIYTSLSTSNVQLGPKGRALVGQCLYDDPARQSVKAFWVNLIEATSDSMAPRVPVKTIVHKPYDTTMDVDIIGTDKEQTQQNLATIETTAHPGAENELPQIEYDHDMKLCAAILVAILRGDHLLIMPEQC